MRLRRQRRLLPSRTTDQYEKEPVLRDHTISCLRVGCFLSSYYVPVGSVYLVVTHGSAAWITGGAKLTAFMKQTRGYRLRPEVIFMTSRYNYLPLKETKDVCTFM